MITKASDRAEYALLQKLASFTKIPKSEFKREALIAESGDTLPIYTYPVIDERFRNFSPVFYSIEVGGEGVINLNELVYPDKWAKSELYKAYSEGASYFTLEGRLADYVLSVCVTGMLWAVYYTEDPLDYGDFIGGIIIKAPDKGRFGYFCIQPVKNFLQQNIDMDIDD